MRRIVATALAGVAGVALTVAVTGCGKKGSEHPTSEHPAAPAAGTEQPAAKTEHPAAEAAKTEHPSSEHPQ